MNKNIYSILKLVLISEISVISSNFCDANEVYKKTWHEETMKLIFVNIYEKFKEQTQ